MKIVFLALAGGGIGHEKNLTTQREFMKPMMQEVEIFWCRFSSEITEIQVVENEILIPGVENYAGLLEKTIKAVQWLEKNIEFDFLIRTNTSNFFDITSVKRELSQFGENSSAGGVFGKWNGPISQTNCRFKFVSGAGIFLNRKAVEIVSAIDYKLYVNDPDDVAISFELLINNTKFIPIRRNDITDHKSLFGSPQFRLKSWKNDFVTQKRFELISSIYQATDFLETFIRISKFYRFQLISCFKENPKRLLMLMFELSIYLPWNVIFFSSRRIRSTVLAR